MYAFGCGSVSIQTVCCSDYLRPVRSMNDVLGHKPFNFLLAVDQQRTHRLLLWTNPHQYHVFPIMGQYPSGILCYVCYWELIPIDCSIIVVVARHPAADTFPLKPSVCYTLPNSVHRYPSSPSFIRIQCCLLWVSTHPKPEFVAVGLCPSKFLVRVVGPYPCNFYIL